MSADVVAQRRRTRPQQRKVAKDPVLKARVEADLGRVLKVVSGAGVVAGVLVLTVGGTPGVDGLGI